MADNIVKYSDFIRPDDSITNAIRQLEQLQTTYADALKSITGEATKLEAAVKKTSGAMTEQQETIERNAVLADKLAKEEEKLKQAHTNAGIELAKYKEINKEQNRITKLELQYNEAKEGSYNKLSAAYSLAKIKLNAMSAAERKGTAAGRELEAQSKKIYLQMTKLQEATGKHTLSVGNYAKGMYGLNTAVNQVTRELPVLGMNLNTFFLAISNNIPMLVDEIDRLRVANKAAIAQGKQTIPVGKAVVKALFSWQTALSVGVALLTIYGKDIVEWIGKLFKGTDALNEQAEAQRRLNEVREEGMQNAQKELVQLDILNNAISDNTRSRKEQLAAVRQLKSQWPEYYKDLSDEEILAGKTADTYNRLVQAIVRSAKARAAEDKLVENYKTILDLQSDINEASEKHAKIRENLIRMGEQTVFGNVPGLKKQEKTIREAYEEINKLIGDNKALLEETNVEDLFNPKGTSKNLDQTLKYLRQWTDSYIDLREEGIEKEIRLTEVKYDREISDLKSKLTEDENLTVKGREAINGIIVNLEKKRDLEIAKLNTKQWDAWVKSEQERIKVAEEASKERYNIVLESVDQEYDLRLSEIDILKTTEAEKTRLRLEAEKARLLKILQLNETADKQLSSMQIETIRNTIKAIDAEMKSVRSKDLDIYSVLGFDLDKEQKKAVNDSFKLAKENLSEYVDAIQDAADAKVAAAEEEVSAAKSALDSEIEARNNGYAYSVTAAQKQLDLARRTEAKALKEQERAQKAQLLLDSISQASNLVTASSKLWTLGFPFAIPALAVMWGSFIGAKIKAAQVTKQSYGEGGLEILGGGSHASGNDVQLGMTKDGKDRRAEGGEALAIISKSKTRKYRKILPSIVNALNRGVFEEKFMNAYNMGGVTPLFAMQNSTDLKTLEKDVGAIRKRGDRSFFVDSKGRTVETYKNLTRRHNVN